MAIDIEKYLIIACLRHNTFILRFRAKAYQMHTFMRRIFTFCIFTR